MEQGQMPEQTPTPMPGQAPGQAPGQEPGQEQPSRRDTTEEVLQRLRRGLREDLADAGLIPAGDVELAERWQGGEMILKPGREGLQEKALSIESFFHKIVMVRERLRVLEQKINNHPKLNDAERVELQEYVTRVHGSLTTFNLLFDDRVDWFVGQSGER
jgi:hypothetical protein